jgi:predicted ribosome quality control (RQC) complex YloA/Tae2 family protein
MKTEVLFIQGLNREIKFYIGCQQNENFKVIDMGTDNDLWFHASYLPSSHVVAEIPSYINNKDMKYIITAGALLCKKYTNKIKSLPNVEFVYTQVKNVVKLSVPGSVNVSEGKIIKI